MKKFLFNWSLFLHSKSKMDQAIQSNVQATNDYSLTIVTEDPSPYRVDVTLTVITILDGS